MTVSRVFCQIFSFSSIFLKIALKSQASRRLPEVLNFYPSLAKNAPLNSYPLNTLLDSKLR